MPDTRTEALPILTTLQGNEIFACVVDPDTPASEDRRVAASAIEDMIGPADPDGGSSDPATGGELDDETRARIDAIERGVGVLTNKTARIDLHGHSDWRDVTDLTQAALVIIATSADAINYQALPGLNWGLAKNAEARTRYLLALRVPISTTLSSIRIKATDTDGTVLSPITGPFTYASLEQGGYDYFYVGHHEIAAGGQFTLERAHDAEAPRWEGLLSDASLYEALARVLLVGDDITKTLDAAAHRFTIGENVPAGTGGTGSLTVQQKIGLLAMHFEPGIVQWEGAATGAPRIAALQRTYRLHVDNPEMLSGETAWVAIHAEGASVLANRVQWSNTRNFIDFTINAASAGNIDQALTSSSTNQMTVEVRFFDAQNAGSVLDIVNLPIDAVAVDAAGDAALAAPTTVGGAKTFSSTSSWTRYTINTAIVGTAWYQADMYKTDINTGVKRGLSTWFYGQDLLDTQVQDGGALRDQDDFIAVTLPKVDRRGANGFPLFLARANNNLALMVRPGLGGYAIRRLRRVA